MSSTKSSPGVFANDEQCLFMLINFLSLTVIHMTIYCLFRVNEKMKSKRSNIDGLKQNPRLFRFSYPKARLPFG
jgi:hypothetical protein